MEENQNTQIPQPTPVSPVQPTQPLPPTPPKSKPLKSLLLVLTGILIGVGGLLGYQYFLSQKTSLTLSPTPIPTSSPTPDPTADWKTYTNNKIGVSFQYPSIWSFSENATKISVDFSTMILSSVLSERSRKLEYIMNVQLENPDNFAQWSKDTAFTKSLGTEIINGLVFEKYRVPDMKLSLNYIHKRPNGDIIRIYIFPYDDEADFNQKLKSTFDQILSTFRFTE